MKKLSLSKQFSHVHVKKIRRNHTNSRKTKVYDASTWMNSTLGTVN